MTDEHESDFSPKPLTNLRFHNLACLTLWIICFSAVTWVFKSGAFVAWDRHVNFGPNPGGLGWLASIGLGVVVGTLAFGALYAQAMLSYARWQLKRHKEKADRAG